MRRVRSTKGVEWPSSIHRRGSDQVNKRSVRDQSDQVGLHLIHVQFISQECIINGVGSEFSLHHWHSIATAGSFVTIRLEISGVRPRCVIHLSLRAHSGDEPIFGAHYHF